jgi:hypothetical protein
LNADLFQFSNRRSLIYNISRKAGDICNDDAGNILLVLPAVLDIMNARRSRDHDDAPTLTPKFHATKPGLRVLHLANFDETTNTIVIDGGEGLFSTRELSNIVGQFRQDRKDVRIDFADIHLQHGGFCLSAQMFTVEQCGFRRKGMEFVWRYDFANKNRDNNFKVVPPEPKPELTHWKQMLVYVRERIAQSKAMGIYGNQHRVDLEDEAFFLKKIAEEHAAKESPEAKELERQITALQELIEGKS